MKPDRFKELVVIAYPNQWHWVLSLEYINQRISQGAHVEVLDLSWCGELGVRNLIRKYLGFRRFHSRCVSWLKTNEIQYSKSHYVSKENPGIDFTKITILSPEDCGASFNSIVERSGELLVQAIPNKEIIIQEFAAMNSIKRTMNHLVSEDFQRVVTVNGRFTKNAAVKEWAIHNNKQTLLLEFGSSQQKFEIFWDSPHSMKECQNKIDTFWKSYGFTDSEKLMEKYMDRFVESVTEKGNVWRTKMTEGAAPSKNALKRCVFFASTESEYAGVGDKPVPGNFKNQVDSFRGLVSALDLNEWEIYLRRHPKHKSARMDDPEQHLWQEFEDRENIYILPPESEVDSIELARSADLNANYCSSIAMELIGLGIQNVITLGPAPWNELIPQQFCANSKSIRDFVSKGNQSLSKANILPWVVYSKNFGIDFTLFKFHPKNSTWSFTLN